MDITHSARHKRDARRIVNVYLILMALLALTVVSAFIDLGDFNPVVNLGIAVAKTVLILVFFMHLDHASPLVRLFAVAGFFWLLLLFGLTMSDYASRPRQLTGADLTVSAHDPGFPRLLRAAAASPQEGEQPAGSVTGKLDMAQLADLLIGIIQSSGAQKDTAVPSLPALHKLNANLTLETKRLVIADRPPLEDVVLQLNLSDGQLSIKSLTARTAGGRFEAAIELDVTTRPFEGTIDASLQQLRLDELLTPSAPSERRLGTLSGDLQLAVTGASAARRGDFLPFIGRLAVRDSRLVYSDPATDTQINATITSGGLFSGRQRVSIQGNGRYQGEDFELSFSGDSLLDLRDTDEPYQVDLTLDIAATEAQIEGVLTKPLELAGLDLSFAIKGLNPSRLYPLVGIALPDLPPYQIEGQLSRQGGTWKLQNFEGLVGDSDLAGDVELQTAGQRLFMRADLVSRKVDFDDLAGLIGAAPAVGPGETVAPAQKRQAIAEQRDPFVLPEAPLDLERVRGMDAAVSFLGQRIEAPDLPLNDLNLELQLDAGRMVFAPLKFGVGGGTVTAQIEIEAGSWPVKGDVEAEIERVNLRNLLRGFEIAEESLGIIGGQARFWVQGDSVAEALGSADGGLFLLMTGGQLDSLLVELAGFDAGESLLTLFGDNRQVPIDCAYANLHAVDGVLNLETVAIDTRDTLFLANGTINLGQETLDLVIEPHPKDLSIFSARSPLYVEGTFKNPRFQPGASALAARGAAAAALAAAVGPLAALIPLIEPGTAEDSVYCSGLVDAMEKAR